MTHLLLLLTKIEVAQKGMKISSRQLRHQIQQVVIVPIIQQKADLEQIVAEAQHLLRLMAVDWVICL